MQWPKCSYFLGLRTSIGVMLAHVECAALPSRCSLTHFETLYIQLNQTISPLIAITHLSNGNCLNLSLLQAPTMTRKVKPAIPCNIATLNTIAFLPVVISFMFGSCSSASLHFQARHWSSREYHVPSLLKSSKIAAPHFLQVDFAK
jgi:hypothetical protein